MCLGETWKIITLCGSTYINVKYPMKFNHKEFVSINKFAQTGGENIMFHLADIVEGDLNVVICGACFNREGMPKSSNNTPLRERQQLGEQTCWQVF